MTDRSRGDDAGAGRTNPLLRPRFVLAIVVAALLLAFALANNERVTVDYLVGDRESRLIYVILGSALLGGLVDRLLVWRHRRRDD